MPADARDKWLRAWLADQISEVMDDGLWSGAITEDEYRRWLRILGDSCALYDLKPRPLPNPHPDPKKLKALLKMRSQHASLQQLIEILNPPKEQE